MGNEEEDDCYSNFELKVIFYEYSGLAKRRITVLERKKEEKESVIFKCYSSEKPIALNTLHDDVPTWYSFFTAESTEAMQIKCLAHGHNILMSGFEQSTSVTRNRHSNH